jgi:hypothetical protein
MKCSPPKRTIRSDLAVGAPSFSSLEENAVEIDRQILETDRHRPWDENTITGGISRTLIQISKLFCDDRLHKGELPSCPMSSHEMSFGAINQPNNPASVHVSHSATETTWGLLAKALQRLETLEKADSEKSLALTECCNRLAAVCELWNQQALELKIVRDERDELGALIAELNKKIESERLRLSGEKQLRMLSEENYWALQARIETVQIECSEQSKRLFHRDIALDNKSSELASLQDKFDRATQQHAETSGALRNQYETELGRRAKLIAQKTKSSKLSAPPSKRPLR